MLIVDVLGPSVSNCCHLDVGARGTFIWGPMLPSALEQCSLCAWHMVFAWGVARALCAWSGAPSALAAQNGLRILLLYVLLEHLSWALLSPMCLCTWAIELVCWLCLVLWLLVLSGPTCLCTWPVELACWLRALHWSLALLGPKYLFTRPVHTACWFLLATLVIGIIGTCVLVEPSFGVPCCPRRRSGAPSALGTWCLRVGGACALCLERCSFGTGRAKWLILNVLLEHWSWALLSPMCLCTWAIELVCWLCLVLWLLVLSGPTCLCTWPVELACWLRALHWSLALLGPKYLFTRPVHTACWFLLATLVIGIIGTCVLVEPSFGVPCCPRRWSGAPSALGTWCLRVSGACALCLERCSFGRAKWLILNVLLEHWSWALLSPMCLCTWAIELVCWLCLVLWLLVLLGPMYLLSWPNELA